MGAAVAPPGMVPGKAPQPGSEVPIRVDGLRSVALRGAVLADDGTRPPLRDPEPVLEHLHGSTSPRRAYQFPRLISRSASISSSLSGHDALEAGVLPLQLPETLGVVGLHPAELVTPPVVGRLGHLQVANHLVSSLPSPSIRSASRSLRMICSGVCRRLAIVMILPSPTIVGNGLTSRVDRSQGVRPQQHALVHLSGRAPCRPQPRSSSAGLATRTRLAALAAGSPRHARPPRASRSPAAGLRGAPPSGWGRRPVPL